MYQILHCHAHGCAGRVQDPLPDRRSSSSNRSGADLFNNLQASGAQHIRPGEVSINLLVKLTCVP